MGMFDFLKKEKSVPAVSNISEATRHGLQKAYIPMFLYKPPFGYPRYADLPTIRRLAAMPYVEMCITTIIDEMCQVKWDIVPKEGKTEEQVKDHKKQIMNFYENPNTNKESFENIRRKYLRDILEIDSGVINKIFNMAGQMVEIVARDGSCFTKNPDIYGMMTDRDDLILDTAILPPNKESSAMAIEPGFITAADARERAAYFQYGWISGARPVPFGKKEIVWLERNPRTDSIYGRAPVQVLAETIQTLIYAIENNLEYFNDNSIPKGIIGLEGSNSEEIEAFTEQWKEQQRKKDTAGNWKKDFHNVPVTGKVPTFTRIQFSNQELELLEGQKWWAKLVWACYDDKTEILTEDGWKLFKDLKDEKVARVNPKDLEIDFIKPIDKQEYDFDGELINYKTNSCDLLVTPEHKMLQCSQDNFYNKKVKWESKYAKDFNKGIIPQAGNFKGEIINELNFKSECKHISKDFDTQEFKITGDNFVKFMGIWLSDGWVESTNNRIVLCASDVYPENKEFIESLLKEMGVDYKIKISKANGTIKGREVKINGDMNYYRFSNKSFRDYLIQFGKFNNKFVPKVILNASKKQRELFLDAFMLGDGSKGSKGKNDRYGSMSKELLNGLQEMLIKNGKSATLFKNNSNGCWELTIRKTKTDKIKNKYYSRISKENVSKQKYKGKVYDVTVPEYHFLIVRRNGRVSISGNCFGVTSVELGYCYSEDTRTLTEDGWKYFWEWKGERIAAVNPDTHEMEWMDPKGLHIFNTEGKFKYFNNQCIDVLVSPNHKMFYRPNSRNAKWQIKEAKDIKNERVEFLQKIDWKGKIIDKIKIPIVGYNQQANQSEQKEMIFKIDDYCEFLGYYLSEGSILSEMDRLHNYMIRISQYAEESKERMRPVLERIGFKSEKGGFRLSNKSLSKYLQKFGNCHTKYIPKEIKNLPKKQLKILLDALIEGDGYRSKLKGANSINYDTVSKRLAEDVQEIMLKIGYITFIKHVKNYGKGEYIYRVSGNLTRRTPSIKKSQISEVEYKGEMYCFSLPKYHLFVTERNGKIGIHSNTEDSKGLANQIVQSNVFKKRCIYPLLRLEEYHHNKEIISEFEFDDVEFKFNLFDVEEETKKANLYKLWIDTKYKSINEIRAEDNLEEVEWGKEPEKQQFNPFGNNNFEEPLEKEENEKRGGTQKEKENLFGQKDLKAELIETKPGMGRSKKWWEIYHALIREGYSKERAAKIASSKETKSMTTGNPLILGENEVLDENRLKRSIIYLLKENEKKIKELIEKEVGKDTIKEIKSIDDLTKKIKSILIFVGLKEISDAVVKNTFFKGWEEAEKQIDQNILVNKSAIEFIQGYTFDNIKGMTEEIGNDLRAELQRGIMAGEGIEKIKARVSKVFDVGETRAEAIARTEVARSEAMGKQIAFQESGEKLKKKIVITHDGRTSELCKRLEGQTVGINEKFKDIKTGGEWVTNPFHVNCRSVVIYIKEGELESEQKAIME